MKFFRNYYPNYHFGLLIIRIGIGIMFMLDGWPKISGGPENWAGLGGALSSFGIDFMPKFWGFMAAFAEFFGGLVLVLGLFFRPAVLLLFFTMVVATAVHISGGDGFNDYSHALESGLLFFGLLFVGAGKYSLDERLFPNRFR